MRRRVLISSFYVHVLSLALALWPALAVGAQLQAATGRFGADAMSKADLVELLATLMRASEHPAFAPLIAAAMAQLVLSAPIQMAWLRALEGGRRREILRATFSRWLPALGVSALVGAATALALAAAVALPLMAYRVAEALDAPLPRLATLALALPALLVLFAGALAHVSARVAVSSSTVFSAFEWALRTLPKTALRFLAYLAAAAAIGFVALKLAGEGSAIALIAAQLALLLRTTLRGSLLASLIETRSHTALEP